MASEELVPSVLGVPMGSVTPLALANPTAANVVLLLDQKIRSETSIFVHPLHNAASLALTPAELETFLGSLGREAVYVDLEAEPVIDQSNPPDLKAIAEMAAPAVGKEGETAEAGAPEPAAAKAAAAPAPKAAKKPAAGKPSKGKEGTAGAAGPKLDIYEIAARLLAKTSAELGQDVNALSADALRRLKADVAMELNIVRNAAYAAGFKAAQASVVAAVQNTFA